jgi:hypothetical protein
LCPVFEKKTAAPANGTTGEVNILTYCTVSAMTVVWVTLPEVAVLGNSVLVRAFCMFSSVSSAYVLTACRMGSCVQLC